MLISAFVCLLGLGFSAFLFGFARTFPHSQVEGVAGAGFFPTIVAVVLFALSALVLASELAGRRMRLAGGSQSSGGSAPARGNAAAVVQVLLLLLLYAALWAAGIGHYLVNSLVIFTLVACIYSRERPWWKNAIFVAVLVVFIYVIFKYLLRIPF